MFRIKICGITSVDDALAAAESGADAIGLNFYPDSPRYCDPSRAREIATVLPASVQKVGVFVNSPTGTIRETVANFGLDLVQLHGDEPPEAVAALNDVPVIRAFRIADDATAMGEYLETCRRVASPPQLVLIDAAQVGRYGGTGQQIDPAVVERCRIVLQGLPWVLAGGLRPGNVAQAIALAQPSAVDTASGVELSPGRKSPALMRDFVRTARAAFEAVSSNRCPS